jgi:hypothetical protein
MRGMRRPDEPYRDHGAATAVRYCSLTLTPTLPLTLTPHP